MASSEAEHLSRPRTSGHFASRSAEKRCRFMTWLCKLLKGGPKTRRVMSGRRHPQPIPDENMVWRAPSKSKEDSKKSEDEELDHAIALSLADDMTEPRYRKPTANDEDFARSLQESLSLPSSYLYCSGCNHEIAYGNYLASMGAFWHPECFRCNSCGLPITEHEFSLSGGKPYHETCFEDMQHPKCEVCHQFIPRNRDGLIEYRSHPFWSQKYCPSHEHDNTVRCCSCERLESISARYISLGDGRSLCLECMESAIMDTGDCQPLYHAIRDFYEGMNMKLDQQIPMLLVERHALNEAIQGEKYGHHHMPETRGLCLSEEQTVRSILGRPRFGGHRLIGMKTHQQRLSQKCEVTAILVLFGLPRLLTGSILAHELMHGWLRLKGYTNLNSEVEEGICQFLSYMWLESEIIPGLQSIPSASEAASSSMSFLSKKGGMCSSERKLGEFFLYQIDNDTSTAYGRGFKDAKVAIKKHGLRRTLDRIRTTGIFPL